MTRHSEALSHAIDEQNAGRNPKAADRKIDAEMADLLEVSALLKKAALPARPPKHVLDATTKRAAAGLAAQKKSRSNAWLYSGVAGAAATALLFFGIHGFPAWQTEVIAPTETQAVSLPRAGSVPTPPASAIPGATSAATPATTPSIFATTPSTSATSPNTQPSSLETPPVAYKQNPPPADTTTPQASTTLKSIPENDPNAAGRYSVTPSSPAGTVTKSAQPPPSTAPSPTSPTALSLPGKKPDSTSIDSATGVIRQVYNVGTTIELVITQRPLPKDKDAKASQTKPIAWREADIAKPNALNKVTVTIQNQEVTIEGLKTKEELLDLSKTLQ